MASRTGLALVEILVGMAVLAAAAVPILTLTAAGRQSTEFGVRRLQAAELCRRLVDQVASEAQVNFDGLRPEAGPHAFVAGRSGLPVSRYGGAFAADATAGGRSKLEQNLDNFTCELELEPWAGSRNLARVAATVRYRFSPAREDWHPVRLETLVVRRSPL